MSVAPAGRPASSSSTETVAGFLAAAAMFVALIGIAYRPVRIEPPAIVISLIAVGMGTRNPLLGAVALAVAASGFLLGMTVAVVTGHPLW